MMDPTPNRPAPHIGVRERPTKLERGKRATSQLGEETHHNEKHPTKHPHQEQQGWMKTIRTHKPHHQA